MNRRAVIAGLAALPLSVACGRVSSQGGNTNGRLIALDRAFNELWRADATASNLGMATQLDDAVLVQFDDGVLRSVAPADAE